MTFMVKGHWYLYVNSELEEIETSGFLTEEAAVNNAEYLAKRYNCEIRCFKLIDTIPAPTDGGKNE